ncbi:MAG: hypothetical protein ACOC5R_05840 [Elusimicrobiota bacterium]
MKKDTVKKILDYYFCNRKYDRDIRKALRLFFSKEDITPENNLDVNEFDEGSFNEWFIYDYRLEKGDLVIEDFCSRNPLGLDKKKLKVYKELCKNIYGIWKVNRVIKGLGMELINKKSGNKYNVKEYKGSFSIKKGDYLFGRVAKLGDHYELVGANPQVVPKEYANDKFKMFIKETDRLNLKTVRDYHLQKRRELLEGFQKRIYSDGKCLCSVCGKKKKMASHGVNSKTGEPLVLCMDCNLEMLAERQGISKAEALKRRKRIFAVTNLFRDIKIEEYFLIKDKKEFDSLEEANKVLERIINTWNSITQEKRKSFDSINDNKLKSIFQKIKVDFKDI